jgi:ABC-type glycerol-3-phosphate transport system permease component
LWRFRNCVNIDRRGAFLSIVPILLLYVFGQRFFIRGLTAGIGK